MLEFLDSLDRTQKRLDRFLPAPTLPQFERQFDDGAPQGSSFESLIELDAKLAAAGHFPLLDWWREQLEVFYGHPTALAAVYRVGRGGAKSNTSVKVGCNEVLNGKFSVPRGEVHYWAQVSESVPEAAERLRLYKSFFDTLGVEYTSAGNTIIIPSLRRGVRVFACQVGSVSGFRCIGYSADEAAKWESRDHSANPAEEVIVSIEAMTVTHPNARSLVISSPWGTDDYHYELFERGNTEAQVVASAASWVANPTLTRETCLAKAKGDEKILVREYEAIPGATISRALDAADVSRAFDVAPTARSGRPFLCIDASSLRGDAFAWIAGYESVGGLVIAEVDGIEDDELKSMKMDDVVERISDRAKAWGIDSIYGDQREEAGLSSLFARRGISLTTFAWSEPSKHDAFTLLRRVLKDEQLSLAEHKQLNEQMLGCKVQLTPSGRMRYPTNGLDYLSAVITLMHAINSGDVQLAPPRPKKRESGSNVQNYDSPMSYG